MRAIGGSARVQGGIYDVERASKACRRGQGEARRAVGSPGRRYWRRRERCADAGGCCRCCSGGWKIWTATTSTSCNRRITMNGLARPGLRSNGTLSGRPGLFLHCGELGTGWPGAIGETSIDTSRDSTRLYMGPPNQRRPGVCLDRDNIPFASLFCLVRSDTGQVRDASAEQSVYSLCNKSRLASRLDLAWVRNKSPHSLYHRQPTLHPGSLVQKNALVLTPSTTPTSKVKELVFHDNTTGKLQLLECGCRHLVRAFWDM